MEKATASRPTRLLQISDSHCYASDDAVLAWSKLPVYPNRSLTRLLEHLSQLPEPYDALVISGDLVQEETAAAYQRVKQLIQDFPLPVYVLPGNHDVPALMQSELVAKASNVHWQIEQTLGDWHCLFLDSSAPNKGDGHLSQQQLDELTQRLQSLPAEKNAIVFLHHHPLSFGSPWMDRMGLQKADQFWDILKAYPAVKAVSFGHIHQVHDEQKQLAPGRSIAVHATPATCVQLKHESDTIEYDHTRPAWRSWLLQTDGSIQTEVHYL